MTQRQRELLKTLCENESALNCALDKCGVWEKYLQQMKKEKGEPGETESSF
jgi:hypothetical protein